MKLLSVFRVGRTIKNRAATVRKFQPIMGESGLEDRAVPAAASPYLIPLELVNIRTPQNPEYKLGIYVGLGGGAPKLYEFDTGGEGFWAAYSSKDCDCQWWGQAKVQEKGTLNITYSSGNVYKANLVSTTVTLFSPGINNQAPTPVVSSGEVQLAQITKFSNNNNPSAAKAWNDALKDDEPPLFGHFYGDFGASLQPIASSKGTDIFSILPQIKMPEGLDVGFVVHVGDINSKTQPYLQIGIDPTAQPADISVVKMNAFTNPSTGQPVIFPVTHVSAYSEQVANATFEIHDKKRGLKQTFANIGWTIDTGAPSATVWQSKPGQPGVNVKKGFQKPKSSTFRDNVDFKITANAILPTQAGFETSTVTGKPFPKIPLAAGRHTTKTAPGWNYINTGLWTFTQFDISFNLTRGLVGFSSVKPAK